MLNNTIGEGETLTPGLYQQIADVLAAIFGTPDDPHFVANGQEQGLLEIDNVILAGGAVTGDRLDGDLDPNGTNTATGQGLYRQHCVHCHGINGDGKGPTAYALNPYPRDFTMGKFKFNSTAIGRPSTDADLHQILVNGINGTAMPSFALLDRGEIEALVDYIKYLGIRGQMERALVGMAGELDEDEMLDLTPETLIGDADGEGLGMLIDQWKSAEVAVAPDEPNVPLFTENRGALSEEDQVKLFDSIDRGRDLYYTAKANCFTCHGPTQLGDGNLGLYDDWSKELYNWQSERDDDGSKKAEYMALGGLEPRIVKPRNLRIGQYRGGQRPIDIFWRINNGIDGSGMPAANGLAHDDIWDLTNYVLSLPHEKRSRPNVDLPSNGRERL